MKNIFIFTVVIFFAHLGSANVWTVENQWSDAWETEFSKWVETSWDDEVFQRDTSVVKGVATDCADASYTMRMTFSYLNKLPFKIYNSNNSVGFITESTNQFDGEADPHQRFINFVNYVNDETDSGSLANDTYPIEISRQYFRPGILYVSPNDHSYQIIKLNQNGIPTIMSSTVPKEARYLQIINSFPFYIPKGFINHHDGYRAFKQPQHYSMKESDLPGYSLKQYELSMQFGEDIVGYGDALAKLLQITPESTVEKIQRAMLNLCSTVQLRAGHITWTLYKRGLKNNACFDSKEYDDESTPSRDQRIRFILAGLELLYKENGGKNNNGYAVLMNQMFSNTPDVKALETWCPVTRWTHTTTEMSLHDVWVAVKNNKFVSDPNANLNQRWGLEDYTPVCPTY